MAGFLGLGAMWEPLAFPLAFLFLAGGELSISPSSSAPSSLEVPCASDVFPDGESSDNPFDSLSFAAFFDAARFSEVISSNSV